MTSGGNATASGGTGLGAGGTSPGGAGNGGANAGGGAMATGGTPANGGATPTGGAVATGGSGATGGSLASGGASNNTGAISILEAKGWLESAHVRWRPLSGATGYNVYYKPASAGDVAFTKIDGPLVRQYPSHFRADVLGLAAGNYVVKVVPTANGAEQISAASTTSTLAVKKHTREGFAFSAQSPNKTSSGGYNEDGTVPSGAQVLYLTADTINSVALDVISGTDGRKTNTVGLSNILALRGKAFDKTPLIIRVIGLIKDAQITGLKDGNYISFKGGSVTAQTTNITFEGVGDDATLHGYGIFLANTKNIEIRNVGVMLFGDDGVSMDTNNQNIWVHNCDFFYGKPGSDADQVKGDGTIDMKYNSSFITISFNHFFDSGKATFAGGAIESGPIYFTYHHNWFDHTDSRNPRLCHATTHFYNNCLDGNATMGLLNTEDTSAFVEANHYKNSKYPMMINMQGTNYSIWPDGEQGGGMTKAYNNTVIGATKLVYQTENATEYDAYLVTSRAETVPTTVKSKTGGNTYSNFDTAPTMYSYQPDAPADVPAVVTSYAGRTNGGDFKWTFTAADDTLTVINVPLKDAITNYASQLVSVGK